MIFMGLALVHFQKYWLLITYLIPFVFNYAFNFHNLDLPFQLSTREIRESSTRETRESSTRETREGYPTREFRRTNENFRPG